MPTLNKTLLYIGKFKVNEKSVYSNCTAMDFIKLS